MIPLAFRPVLHPPLNGAPVNPLTEAKDEKIPVPKKISGKEIAYSHALQLGIIDESGSVNPQKNSKLILEDQAPLLKSLSTEHNSHFFPWNLASFLHYFIPYFSETLKAHIVMTKGALQTIGPEFAQQELARKLGEEWMQPEMLNFCTGIPAHYELSVTFPESLQKECNAIQLKRFQEMAIYFLALQGMDEKPKNYVQAINEFNLAFPKETYEVSLLKEKIKNRLPAIYANMNALRQKMPLPFIELDPNKKPLAILEIDGSPGPSLKITFGFSTPNNSSFQLDISSYHHNLEFNIPSRFEKLHDLLMNRISLTPMPSALGSYWAHQTTGGAIFESEKLRAVLVDALKKEPDLMNAITYAIHDGRKNIALGIDSHISFIYHVVQFLKRLPKNPSLDYSQLNGLIPTTPLGKLILERYLRADSCDSILHFVGMLVASAPFDVPHAPKCRFAFGNQIEILCASHYLVFDLDTQKISKELADNGEDFFATLSETLKVFVPSFNVPFQGEPKECEPLFENIYRSLLEQKSPDAIRFYFLLIAAGRKTIHESFYDELQNWATLFNASTELLDSLKGFYANGPLAAYYADVQKNILALNGNRNSETCRQAFWKPLLDSQEPKATTTVWAQFDQQFQGEKRAEGVPFLLEIASTLHETALSVALNRVCDYCSPKSSLPEETKFKLLVPFLDRMLKHPIPSINLPYENKLLERLQFLTIDISMLQGYPSIINKLVATFLANDSLRRGPSDFSSWCCTYTMCQQNIPQKELDGFIEKDLRASSSSICEQPGFAEIWKGYVGRRFQNNEEARLQSQFQLIPKGKFKQLVGPYLPQLLTYYSQLAEPPILLEELEKGLALFIEEKDLRISPFVNDLVSFLLQHVERKELWLAFDPCLEQLEGSPLFLDEAIGIREKISSLDDLSIQAAPFICFKRKMPKAKRTAEQRIRLAKALGKVIVKAAEANAEEPFIQALPSPQWVQEIFKAEELWEEFGRFYISTTKSPIKANQEEALWIATRLAQNCQSSLFAEFVTFLTGHFTSKSLERDTWKPLLCRFLAHDPSNGPLFSLVLSMTIGAEKQFFEKCQAMQKKSQTEEARAQLSAYSESGSLPEKISAPKDPFKETRGKIKTTLSVKPMTFKNLKIALSLLEALPNGEFPLWEQFLNSFASNTPTDFFAKCWKVWVDKHPIHDFNATEEKYWHQAIEILFPKIPTKDFLPFLNDHAPAFLGRLTGMACKKLVSLCLEKGTTFCWEGKDRTTVTQAMENLKSILTDKDLKNKVGDLLLTLQNKSKAALMVMSIHQKEGSSLRLYGEEVFESYLQELDRNPTFDSPFNISLLTTFCEIPYIPVEQKAQSRIYTWFARSFVMNESQFIWISAVLGLKTFCQFNLDWMGAAEISVTIRQFVNVWLKISAGTIESPVVFKGRKIISERKANQSIELLSCPDDALLLETTLRFVKKFMFAPLLLPTEKLFLLDQIWAAFNQNVICFIRSKETLCKIQLFFCTHFFSLYTHFNESHSEKMRHGLIQFNIILNSIKLDSQEKEQSLIGDFIASLPAILNLSDPEIVQLIPLIFDNLMKLPWVMNAKYEDKFGWPTLLVELCKAVSFVNAKRKLPVVRLAKQTFLNCTQIPEIIPKIGFQRNYIFLPITFEIFINRFMILSELDCLPPSEMQELIQIVFPYGFNEDVSNHVSKLCTVPNEGLSLETYKKNLLIARIIHYSKPTSKGHLYQMLAFCNIGSSPELEACAESLLPSLHIGFLTQWILAISALSNTCESIGIDFNGDLFDRKIDMAKVLITLIFSSIKDEESFKTYSNQLISLSDDADVGAGILESLSLPPKEFPENLMKQFSFLKSIIAKRFTAQILSYMKDEGTFIFNAATLIELCEDKEVAAQILKGLSSPPENFPKELLYRLSELKEIIAKKMNSI